MKVQSNGLPALPPGSGSSDNSGGDGSNSAAIGAAMTSAVSEWFNRGVNSVIYNAENPVSDITPVTGANGDTTQLTPVEYQLQFFELICQIDRICKSSKSIADINAAIAQIKTLLNDPNAVAALGGTQGTDYARIQDALTNAAAAVSSGDFTKYTTPFGDPNKGFTSMLSTWFTSNASDLQAMFAGFGGSYNMQAMQDVINFSLIMIDIVSIPTFSSGTSIDQAFFKPFAAEIALNLPNAMYCYFYQQGINDGLSPADASQLAIAQVQAQAAEFPPADSGASTPYYDQTLNAFKNFTTPLFPQPSAATMNLIFGAVKDYESKYLPQH